MAPPSRTRHPLFLLSALLVMLGSVSASAQWVVYDMRMVTDQTTSVNFVHYTGSYLIAPIAGGAASLVFTTEEGGRFYATSENGARFFVASNLSTRRAVVSATANGATSQSMYLASGPLNNTYSYVFRNQRTVAIIASDLSGQLMTADDEHLTTIPAIDGSLGVVGTASFKGFFRKDLADQLNTGANTMDQAVDLITTLLEKYGYQSESEPKPASTAPITSKLPPPTTPTVLTPVDTQAAEGSLFPAGLRDEMANSLLQPTTTK